MCWVAGGEVSWAVQRAASEVSRERQRGVWAWQRRRGGGQDQTFPVACTTTAILARQWQILQPPAPYYPRVIHVVMKSGGAPGGDFPSLKQSLDPSLICVLTQQGCGIQFTPELHSSSRVQAHSEPKRRTHREERESRVTSRKPTKIHKCHSAPFCVMNINVSLKKNKMVLSDPLLI